MEAYLQQAEREERDNANAMLMLIIKNAQEGRFGHSNFKDSDQMKAKNEVGKAGPSKRFNATGAGGSSRSTEAARTEIAQARDEVNLATSSGGTSGVIDPTQVGRTEKLAGQFDQHVDIQRALRNHI